MPIPLRALLDDAASLLHAAGVADARVDAELLAAHLTGTSRGGIQAAAIRGDAWDDGDAARLADLVERRATREPLQHITGTAPFRTIQLRVGPGVFVPRPETELLAQIAIDDALALPVPEPVVVDLGTGSGAIALAIATEVPHARVTGVEASVDAFVWARENAAALALPNARIVFDDFSRALPELEGTVDVLVSNPPYVPSGAVPRDPEVARFDPAAALYSGADGLDAIRVLAARGAALVRPGGLIALEHGEWQGAGVREALSGHGWILTRTHPDLTGRDRVTTARRP